MDTIITTRISKDAAKDLLFFTKEEQTDKSTLVRKLLLSALEKRKIEFVLQKYQEGEITLGKAAELAGIPLRKMLRIAVEKKIPFQYSLGDLEKDFKAAQ